MKHNEIFKTQSGDNGFPKIDLEELNKDKEDVLKERREFSKRYAEWLRKNGINEKDIADKISRTSLESGEFNHNTSRSHW